MQNIFPFNISNFSIKLNTTCNLNCTYCRIPRQERQKSCFMSWDILETFYNRLLSNPNGFGDAGNYNIQLSETEPLLSYDIIEKAFNSLPIRKFCHSMNTNGILLTREKLEFLQEFSVYLRISIGGEKKELKNNDEQIESILKNISYAKKPHRISLTYVITPERMVSLKEDLNFIWKKSLGFGQIAIILNVLSPWNEKDYNQMIKIVSNFLQYNYHPKKTLFLNNPSLFNKKDVFLSVEPNGNLYIPPPTRTSKHPTDKTYLNFYKKGFGTIFDPDIEKIQEFINYYGENFSKVKFVNKCETCISQNDCNPPSPQKIVSETVPFQLSDQDCLTYIYYRKVLNNMQFPDIDYEALMSTTSLYSVCLGITNDCNMKCPYCFATASEKHMDLGTAKSSLMKIIEMRKERNQLEMTKTHVNFFGGEPMMRFDEIIKPLVEWSQEMGFVGLSFGMTTNGTFFTPERIKWCADNSLGLLLSVDGGPETQNINRPLISGEDSFLPIFEIHPILLHYYPDVTFRSTVYPSTAHLLYKNYLWAKEMGFNHYYCTPDEFSDWGEAEIQAYASNLQKIYWHMYECITKKERVLHIQEFFDELKDAIKPNKETNFTLGHLQRCGLGTSSMGISINGGIFGCQEHTTREKNIFYIGDVFTGIDKKRHLNLLRTYAQDCLNKGSICPSHSYGVLGSLTEPTFARKMYRNLMRKVVTSIFNTSQEQNNEVFLEYSKESFKKRGMM